MELEAINKRLEGCGLRVLAIDESGNPPVESSTIPFGWQDLHHPGLARLAETYRLAEVIGRGRDEFEQLRLLRHWCFRTIARGMPEWVPHDPELLAGVVSEGRPFYCTYYAQFLMYAATALGWPARHIGIDCDHAEGEQSTHHGVTELFCFTLDKWLVLDAMFDVHYEREGVPLSALEIRDTYRKHGPQEPEICVGPEGMRVRSSGKNTPAGFDEPACYYWFLVRSRNDHFTLPVWQGNARDILYVDDVNREKTWYQNRTDDTGQFVGSRRHTGYETGSFLVTERVADVYPTLGRTHIEADLSLPRAADRPVVPLCMHSICPYWRGFEVRFDRTGPWVPVRRSVDWTVHSGENAVEARLIDAGGRRGKACCITLKTGAHSSK